MVWQARRVTASPPSSPAGQPVSTYRLQLSAEFTLDDAAGVVRYLAGLGVDAVYLSPVLAASAGSTHGYDTVDPTVIDGPRGGEAGWRRLVDACRTAGLQIVVDIVPNHLGVADATENPAWWDVLRYGRDSVHAAWFDIDWSTGVVLLPVLGADRDVADLEVADGELRYYEHRFPLAPGTGPQGDDTAADVHERQHYRLVGFRHADTDQNYRRFFAVTTLAGVRLEDPAVFDATHARIARWIADGEVDGLRVDHPDGLADPAGYLDRLRSLAPTQWLVVEKILEPGEELPDWPVDGTTGYDAMTEVDGVFADPVAQNALDAVYREVTGDDHDFSAHAERGKRDVVTSILQAEVGRIARLVESGGDADSGVDTAQLMAGLAELAIAFPVYRSYLPVGADHLAEAVATVRQRRPELADTVAALLPRLSDPRDEVCVRFQQLTGAAAAKGVEDTAYYRYTRFVAANEVGGDPTRIGRSVQEFHDAQAHRLARWPRTMTARSTHDTKRGEDVRAALAVLSELVPEWQHAVSTLTSAAPVPDPGIGPLLWQTFAAVGHIDRDRMHAYLEKAMREAATGTGWVDPDEPFEAAVHAAVDAGYDDPTARSVIVELRSRMRPHVGTVILGAKLVGLTAPGVPDVYNGTEFTDDSLVDPDNRRPADWTARLDALRELDTGRAPSAEDVDRAKLHVTAQALRLRRDRPDLFDGYRPVDATGPVAAHVLAFDRGGAVTLATRLPVALARSGGWRDTCLDLAALYRDVLTGRDVGPGTVRLTELLAVYPVALLARPGNQPVDEPTEGQVR